MRPPELATDTAPEWLAWRHAIDWFERERGAFDVFVSLPATSPFRSLQDVESCIDTLVSDPAADAVVTVREAADDVTAVQIEAWPSCAPPSP